MCKRQIAKGRQIVAVDLENVVGGPYLTAEAVNWAKSALLRSVPITRTDHIVVATSPFGALTAGCAWTGIRQIVRSGRDGADLALLDVLAENIAQRFERVIIASGDGIFAPTIASLVTAGVKTTVVGRRGHVARRLQTAASEVVYLPELPPPATPAAA